jgi:hypothetical protein
LQAGASTSEETAIVPFSTELGPYTGPPESVHHLLLDPSHVNQLYGEVTAERGIAIPADLDLNEEANLLGGVSIVMHLCYKIFLLLTSCVL